MGNDSIRLILNGLPLENPFVGQGAYTLRLVLGLQKYQPNDFAVAMPAGADLPSHGVTARTIKWPRRFAPTHALARQMLLGRQLLNWLACKYPDAVFHSPAPIAGPSRPRRTIVTLHDCIYRTFPNYLGRFVLRKLYMKATERFGREASLVLTDSEFSKSDLVNRANIPPEKIDVLYPWVGNEFINPILEEEIESFRRRCHLPPRFWLYLGGYDYRKNVEMLIRAYGRIASSKSVPPLVLAGSIPASPSRVVCDVFGAIREAGLSEDKITMPGLIPVADLPFLLKAASLLVYPSLMEGFGLPPAEAAAVATPVLSSNTSSLPEVVKNPDSLFDPNDQPGLTERLEHAATNPARFITPFPEAFTETFAIRQYLSLVEVVHDKP